MNDKRITTFDVLNCYRYQASHGTTRNKKHFTGENIGASLIR